MGPATLTGPRPGANGVSLVTHGFVNETPRSILALAVAHGHALQLEAAVLAQLFGLFDQWFIVWANDLADEATDRANATATPFSGGSRVLVEGRLTRAALTRAAALAALGCVGVAAALTALHALRDAGAAR
jgi:4-hydroxybenzoate polyprenyltransferase